MESTSSTLRWPAEWEAHQATWLSWPHNQETWKYNLRQAQQEFVAFAKELASREHVYLLIDPLHHEQAERIGLKSGESITFVEEPTNDAWIRDYGPVWLSQTDPPNLIAVGWQYDAWGKKYPPFDRDQLIASKIAAKLSCPFRQPSLVLEGGAIEGNGHGIVLVTESCLLDSRRNADISVPRVEESLMRHLNAKQIVWLPGGDFVGDDTDGHIDQLARFLPDRKIVFAYESDANDANSLTLKRNAERLQMHVEQGRLDVDLIPIDLPSPVIAHSEQLPASYLNFAWANESIIVPQFEDKNDKRALSILRELCPGRDVIGLPCRNLVVGLGAWHCLSNSQPRLTPST